MVQISSRLGLRVPESTDPFLVTDFQTNWGRVDNYPGIFTTTSGSRPSSPWAGQHIYETDTDQTLVYDGTNWGPPVSTLAWVWWAGISPWLTTSGTGSSPLAGSFYTYGAHKFRVPTNRPNQALILSGAMSFEMEDPSTPGVTNFAGTSIFINGNELPKAISTATALDLDWELYPFNRPSLNSGGNKYTMAVHPQVIAIGSGATNAKLSQDNSINVKLQNGFLNGRVRCTNYTLQMFMVTLGPGSNKAPGTGSISTTALI